MASGVPELAVGVAELSADVSEQAAGVSDPVSVHTGTYFWKMRRGGGTSQGNTVDTVLYQQRQGRQQEEYRTVEQTNYDLGG